VKEELDFIVIGAQKSGTTSLFEYLRRHPQLRLPAAKEVPYFSHDANYGTDWRDYLSKAFPFADEECKWGTVTPHYMVGGIYDAAAGRDHADGGDERTVPRRIYEKLPAVRLIAILRDPVERARSHHAMAVMNGWETRNFAEAIAELLPPDALASARRLPTETTGYVAWGEYGRILAGYLDVFPRAQLLVLETSELKRDPATVLRNVYRFLDVDPGFVPDNLGTNYRPSGAARRLRWLDLNAVQAAVSESRAARACWHSLPERTRRRVDRQFDRLNYLTDLWNRVPRTAEVSGDAETNNALGAHYEQDGELLTRLLGAAPSWISRAPTPPVGVSAAPARF
jgi:hypothetical protein